jgi:DNA polymerase
MRHSIVAKETNQIEIERRRAARARLALRAERAFGLESIRRPLITDGATEATEAPEELSTESHAAHGPMPVPPGATFTEATRAQPAAQAAGAVDLFGKSIAPPATGVAGLHLPVTGGAFSTPELSSDEKRQRLHELDEKEVRGCTRCRLCEQRTHTVFGEGSPDAKIFFIGEGPGQTEDETGRPFVGRAGELLNKMIAGMGLKREDVFIANVVKCRPPGNREPALDEVATCTPYLERQLEIVRPRVIVTLGRPATQHMLATKNSMSRMRGQWHEWRGIRLMPTFHPAYLLRSYTRENREMVWSDLQQVMRELGMPMPKRGGT